MMLCLLSLQNVRYRTMALVTCRECSAQISLEAVSCPRCGCPSPQTQPKARTLPAGAKRWSAFYAISITIGVLIAGYIYLIAFDEFSETRLVQITPVWFFPIVFGYYGFVAQRMAAKLPESGFDRVANLLFSIIKETQGSVGKLFGLVVHAPFIIVKSKRPILVAFGGAAIWAVMLFVFFTFIFPKL
jgi:ribosomal protein L40E